jgi:2-amino-4-hydroxy-6-hydroxymethyldihydropteridine diphosphokinase
MSARTVHLLLGSNLGDRLQSLRYATAELAQRVGKLEAASKIYQSEPWGSNSENWYINQAIALSTTLHPTQILAQALAIERDYGRIRSHPNADRTLDIDLLLCEDWVWHSHELILPHPRLLERRFALLPLSDIAPFQIIPGASIDVKQALALCNDTLSVKPQL